MRSLVVTAWIVLWLAGLAGAARAQGVATDPLQCWWRSSAGGVRVGETFSLVLTCAVVETDTVKVVPDQAPLDPKVIQFPPFEVTGGAHAADLRTDDHRFFQYAYQVHLISEDVFGKDVKLPDTKVSYKIQTRVGGSAVEGRDQTYLLPSLALRVLSMVPAQATDIRDQTAVSFGAVDARVFRANLLRTIAGVLFALAALSLLPVLTRLIRQKRTGRKAADRLIGDAAVLGSVNRELASVRRERQDTGWTPSLASRLATSLRIAAGYALSRPPVQKAARPGAKGVEGHLLVRTAWPRRRRAVVSSAVTPYTLAQEREHPSDTNGARGPSRVALLEELETALGHVTLMQYGREKTIDDPAMDEALETGSRAARRLRIAHTWPMQKAARVWPF